MRGVYKRGNIFWIACKAGQRFVQESTGSCDRKLAAGALAKRRAEVFEGRWVGRMRDIETPLHQGVEEYMKLYSMPRKVSWRDDQRMLILPFLFRTFAALKRPYLHYRARVA